MALLEFDVDGIHKIYTITKKCTTIGRGSEVDIQFKADSEISKRHSSVLMKDEENYLLRDDNSTNGTQLNDQMLDITTAVSLQDGDEIHIGNTFITFHK